MILQAQYTLPLVWGRDARAPESAPCVTSKFSLSKNEQLYGKRGLKYGFPWELISQSNHLFCYSVLLSQDAVVRRKKCWFKSPSSDFALKMHVSFFISCVTEPDIQTLRGFDFLLLCGSLMGVSLVIRPFWNEKMLEEKQTYNQHIQLLMSRKNEKNEEMQCSKKLNLKSGSCQSSKHSYTTLLQIQVWISQDLAIMV